MEVKRLKNEVFNKQFLSKCEGVLCPDLTLSNHFSVQIKHITISKILTRSFGRKPSHVRILIYRSSIQLGINRVAK